MHRHADRRTRPAILFGSDILVLQDTGQPAFVRHGAEFSRSFGRCAVVYGAGSRPADSRYSMNSLFRVAASGTGSVIARSCSHRRGSSAAHAKQAALATHDEPGSETMGSAPFLWLAVSSPARGEALPFHARGGCSIGSRSASSGGVAGVRVACVRLS